MFDTYYLYPGSNLFIIIQTKYTYLIPPFFVINTHIYIITHLNVNMCYYYHFLLLLLHIHFILIIKCFCPSSLHVCYVCIMINK